ncbi:MAG: phosphate/phosphite/phosphonate ABC transporter substrate-binding protein [Burkholderiales bacterium]|nr:phosphate/phosphite/phosphonate ABC transporter substrate-binding protein [Burkholderiales bacterium]
MTHLLTVSPDFSPDHIAGWYVFNTWLQRRLGTRIHFEMHDSFAQQREAVAADKIDLIYASPNLAAMLVREKGFTAIAAPLAKADEAVIAVLEGAPTQHVEDLQPGLRIAQTQDPDVNMIAMIMLEPADLNRDNTVVVTAPSYVLVAKQLMTGKADCGFFLREAFDDLSGPVRRQLRVLVKSEIGVIRHMLLAGPRLAEHHAALRELIGGMSEPGSDGKRALDALGLAGFELQQPEDVEFMIDMVNTLTV